MDGGTASPFFCPPECHHAATGDHLEKTFFVSRPHVAAIQPHRHGSVRQGQRRILFRFQRIGLRFLAQLHLHPLGDALQMFAHRFVIRGLTDRQHFFQ
ncbi:MAG: hypothetical protein ACRD2B_06595 [Terriglobia bacterium]